MAGEAAKAYTNLPAQMAEGKLKWKTDDIRVVLCSSLYVPDQDNHKLITDITNEIAAGGGYTTGGIPLSGRDIVVDPATNKTQLKANNFSVLNSTITARYAIIVNVTSGIICGYVLLGSADVVTGNSEFQINWNNGVVINLTAAA